MPSPLQSLSDDPKVEELRAIAGLTESGGWALLVRELENKQSRALREVYSAEEEDDKKLLAQTRKWLALRDAISIVKNFPIEIRRQLEESGDAVYGYRKLES